MKLRRWKALVGGIVTSLLVACGGGGSGGGGGIGGTGTMRIGLTDAPSCGYDEVNISIVKVRVHQSADAGDNDAGWSELVLNPVRRVDLLTLQNGVIESLGELPLTAGSYTQMRLVLAENDHASPLANSVVPTGEDETALDTPSGQQSGVKINLDATVSADQVMDVVLDFDACKSVVKAGNSGHYKLKPVIQAIPLLTTAGQGVVGYVDPALSMADTRVSVQVDGMAVKTTAPDGNGKFVLYPVPVGTYDLVITAEGRATAVMTGVPTDTVDYTYVNSAMVPIVPGPAPLGLRPVVGTLAPATAAVRALQSFTAGPTVEVSFGLVDSLTGAYTLALPIDAPLKTAYVPSPTSITFTADAAAAGLYTLEAESDGVVKTQPIDTRVAVPPVNFSFP
ncbi:MAG TPA: DUF4382 domain-containing protein [Ideonella sp.]|uniref:DUF4382 domain-containing protein n=1 Tax=Ideonella sp. TaxID=1929293 RepID=UPI002E3011D4|nr:DUF4382 domain-containing protein [Ideonella sp.]HEX5688325.1 DUF4382 domain-containing protein [Ideonella sp.]